jgi:penicillin-binding protein 1C
VRLPSRRLVVRGFAAAGALALIACGAFALSLGFAPFPVESFDDVKADWRSADAWLLDRHGTALSRVRIDHGHRRGDWVALEEVSPALVDAVIASEDRRFHAHAGVDWLGMLGAVKQSSAGERRGGSTLTMQLAAHLNPELEWGGQRGPLDKWRQMRQALAIERTWSKDHVMEAWLNLTPFRGEIEGVDAAARAIAGKLPAGLDRAEAAVLAALARSPNAPAERVARRACVLAGKDELVCRKAQALADLGLNAGRLRAPLEGDAPHLARELLDTPGAKIVSTLDAPLQRFAHETLARHLRELAGRNVEDGALVVIDNASGDVLAYVGSGGEMSRAGQVDGAVARRLAGSTLKPFLYELAIEERVLTAASILDDSPLAVTTAAGLYVPQNYDRSFKGPVTLRQALAASLNVPAVRTLALIGYEPFHARLRRLGLDTLDRDAEHYGYGLALGGGEVTLLTLTNAYRSLANGGRVAPVRFLAGDAEASSGEQVMEEGAAYVVSDILADPAARAITFGLSSPLHTRYRASVKTGTSKDMRDNWAIGFTDRYTVGVWVGNFSGDAMHDVSGVTGAAPVWRELMDYLHASSMPGTPAPPAQLLRVPVRFEGGLEPDRDEWFIAGTQSELVARVEAPAGHAKLDSPADGAVYAIDPDIPAARQRIVLRAHGADPSSHFILPDGRQIAAARPFLWDPAAGHHRVALVDGAGRVLDQASFEVR